jgi:hypothetical protein
MRGYAFIPFPLLLCGCVVPQPASTPAPSTALSSAQRIVVRTVASRRGPVFPDLAILGWRVTIC